MIVYLTIDQYRELSEIRDLYDANLPLTSFVKKYFNATLQHKSKSPHKQVWEPYNTITDNFTITLIFDTEQDIIKYNQIINKDGPYYNWFLLQT